MAGAGGWAAPCARCRRWGLRTLTPLPLLLPFLSLLLCLPSLSCGQLLLMWLATALAAGRSARDGLLTRAETHAPALWPARALHRHQRPLAPPHREATRLGWRWRRWARGRAARRAPCGSPRSACRPAQRTCSSRSLPMPHCPAACGIRLLTSGCMHSESEAHHFQRLLRRSLSSELACLPCPPWRRALLPPVMFHAASLCTVATIKARPWGDVASMAAACRHTHACAEPPRCRCMGAKPWGAYRPLTTGYCPQATCSPSASSKQAAGDAAQHNCVPSTSYA